ncbi:MAG: flagellar biosynthetic protein FliO [Sulfuricella sp.]|nr:flagellar biosynthetic protein FliO [Sulfuricella sp.]
MIPPLLATRFILALAVLSPYGAFAQQVSSQSASPTAPLSMGGVFQVLLGLLMVLATIAATVWLLKRFPVGRQAMGGVVRVVGGVAVGPRERLVLVEIGETWLLLGVAPGQVNTLHTLPKPADAPKIETLPEPAFSIWLKQAMHRRTEK